MSAVVGALTWFHFLAFLLVGLGFAADSVREAWSRARHPVPLPHVGLTDDERILTTVAAPNPGVAETLAPAVKVA
jgi:hypothetical protein